MILVDANLVSETSKLDQNPSVLDWIDRNEQQLYLPTVVVAELRYGCEKLPESAKRASLEVWLESVILRYSERLVDFDYRAAEAHGRLRAHLKARGKQSSAPDSYIAAQAISLGVPVATRNVKHFVWTGVKLINPWQA